MPELNASGEIFTLDGRAGFDEGIVRGELGGGARLSFEGHFDLCHGLRGALAAEAVANAEAQLGALFFLAGQAQGEALAAAGLRVDCGVQLDVFDAFGLSAEAAAYAEASVAGRAEIRLSFQDAAAAARQLLPGLAYQLFVAFLNEVDVAAGAWGKASFAAMAKARLKIRGSLADDENAGFLIEAGAEAAWGGGAGQDFYAGIRFRSAKRFYLTAVELITEELVRQARQALPADAGPAIEALRLYLPIALNAAYELGQTLPLATLPEPEDAIGPFVANFAAQLQRYTLDRLVECGLGLLDATIRGAISQAVRALTDAQRQIARQLISALIHDLQQPVAAPSPLDVVGRLADILGAIAPDLAAEWRQPLTVMWLASAAVDTLRRGAGATGGSFSFSVVGLGPAGGAQTSIRLPDPPAIVRAELNAFFDPDPPRIELSHAVRYLAGTVASSIPLLLPDVAKLIEPLAAALGLTAGEILDSALAGLFGEDFSRTQLYQHLRDVTKGAIDTDIRGRLMPALRAHTAAGSDLTPWLDEAAEPSLLLLSEFVFRRLDALAGGTAGDASPFLESFRSALSAVVSKIFARNVAVLADVLHGHVVDALPGALHDLAGVVRSSPDHPVARGALTLTQSLLPRGLQAAALARPSADLAADLLLAAAAGFGPQVWTRARRTRQRELVETLLLSIDGDVDYSDGDAIDDFFRTAAECAFLPDGDAALDLTKLELEVLGDQIARMLPLVAQALQRFYLAVTAPAIDQIDRTARDFLQGLVDDALQAWNLLQDAIDDLQRLQQELEAAAQAFAARLEDAKAVLRSPARRSDVLDAVREEGIAKAKVEAARVPGFDLLSADLRRAALDAAAAAFDAAFSLVRPALDAALAVIAPLAGGLADLIEASTGIDDALGRLGRQVRDQVVQAINNQLGVFHVALPSQLSVDEIASVARQVIAGLPSLRSAIQQVFSALTNRRNKQGQVDDAARRKAHATAAYAARRRRSDEAQGGPIDIRILSPAPVIVGKPNFAYRGAIDLRIDVAGAALAFVEPAGGRRVWLSINGQPISVPLNRWKEEDDILKLRSSFIGTPLRAGLNLLEVTVVRSRSGTVRRTASFVLHAGAAAAASLAIDAQRSALPAAAGRVDGGKLVIANRGTASVDLKGWQVLDRARHAFVFPSFRLEPMASVTLWTRAGRNSGNEFHWDRPAAAQAETGDTVYLVDPAGDVRSEQDFGGRR
jgi:Lamin Tail Domain